MGRNPLQGKGLAALQRARTTRGIDRVGAGSLGLGGHPSKGDPSRDLDDGSHPRTKEKSSQKRLICEQSAVEWLIFLGA